LIDIWYAISEYVRVKGFWILQYLRSNPNVSRYTVVFFHALVYFLAVALTYYALKNKVLSAYLKAKPRYKKQSPMGRYVVKQYKRYYRFNRVLLESLNMFEGRLGVAVNLFILFDLSLFVVFLFSLLNTTNVFIALIISLFTASAPYLIMMFLLRRKQIEGSHEFVAMLKEFTKQYEIHEQNLVYALKDTVKNARDCDFQVRALSRFLYKINENRIDDAYNDYVFSTGTFYNSNFCNYLKIAAESGQNITAGLVSIINHIPVTREDQKQNKTLNFDSRMTNHWLIPMFALAFFGIKAFVFRIPLFEILKIHFSGMGMRILLSVLVGYIVSRILLSINDNRMFDF